MRRAKAVKPTLKVNRTDKLLNNEDFTYNETSKTYNQAGMTYGGVYLQDIYPIHLSIKDPFASTSAIFTAGLISYWKLEEASGATRLDSQGSNDLSDTNTVTQVTGKVAYGAGFTSASSTYLTTGADPASLSMGAGVHFTITAWVFFNSLSGVPAIIAKYDYGSNNREYQIAYRVSANRFGFFVSSNGTNETELQADNFGAAATGTWYFIAVWYDGVNIYISVNDGTPDSTAFTADVADKISAFYIGANNGGTGGYLNGRVDEVGVWKRVLTSGQRTLLYNSGNGFSYPF